MTVSLNAYMHQTVTFTGRRLHTDPVTGDPVRDRYGNDVYDQVTFDVPECVWEPRGPGEENLTQRSDQVTTGLVVYCTDPAVDVREQDKATIDGLDYEVKGRPARFTGSRWGNDYAAIYLERVTG